MNEEENIRRYTKQDLQEAFRAGMRWQDYNVDYEKYKGSDIVMDDFDDWFRKKEASGMGKKIK